MYIMLKIAIIVIQEQRLAPPGATANDRLSPAKAVNPRAHGRCVMKITACADALRYSAFVINVTPTPTEPMRSPLLILFIYNKQDAYEKTF